MKEKFIRYSQLIRTRLTFPILFHLNALQNCMGALQVHHGEQDKWDETQVFVVVGPYIFFFGLLEFSITQMMEGRQAVLNLVLYLAIITRVWVRRMT